MKRLFLLLPLAVLPLALLPAFAQPPQEPPREPEAAVEAEHSTPGEAGEPAREPQEEAAAAEPAVAPERIRFSFPFSPERGGTVTGNAGAIDLEREQYLKLSDGVEIRFEDLVVRAQRAEVDLEQKTVTAAGDVVIEQGPERLSATTATYDLEAKTGTLTDCSAALSEDYYFHGAEVSKVAEDVYTLEDGVFTSCIQTVPNWSFKVSRARIRVDGFAKVKNASLRVKDVPVLWVPYMLWPVREERTSGFLFPHIGYSERRGASLSLAWFQTLGRSYDTTFEVDLYSEEFFGFGNELRYRPSEGTEGVFEGYLLDDPVEDEVRWKVRWDHESRNLPFGMRGVIRFQDFSDFNFFRDFERDFDRNTLRFLDSRAFVSGNWGTHSLNVMTNRRETFISEDRTITLDKLPEIEYRLRPTRLGRTPLYAQIDSSLSFLALQRSEALDGDYLRADLFPQLTLPLRTVPWLSVSFTAGERFTFYGDSLFTAVEQSIRPPEEVNRFRGESLTRTIPFGSGEIVGPSISRIFNKKPGGRWGKIKHVFEPRWTYTFRGDLTEEEQERIALFDEVDSLRSTNRGRFSLINRLLAKPAGKEGGSGREILSLELAQEFSFDEEQPLQRGTVTEIIDGVPQSETLTRSAGPILALLRYNPGAGLSIKAQANYNTLFKEIGATSLSATYGVRGNSLDLTWFTRTRPETGETTQNQVRLGGAVKILPNRLRLIAGINYDFELAELQQYRWVLEYSSQCCGLRFEWRDFQAGTFQDTDFRIAISLKNVGTFLDFTGGSERPR